MKELIIIPFDGVNSSDFMRKKVENATSHVDLLNEYIKDHNINLDPETSMYIQGVLMAMSGYCVIGIADFNFDAFIPRKLTKSQYNWFNDNITEVSKYSVSAELMDEDEGIIQIKRTIGPGNNPLAKFYSLLEKRIDEEVKVDDIRRGK